MKCNDVLEQTRADVEEAKMNAVACPSNCGKLDCRAIRNMLEIVQACIEYKDKVKAILGPSEK